MKYTDINSKTIDRWCDEGWEWGIPITHEEYELAKSGKLEVLLTPTKYVPRDWFPKSLKGLKVLGLASGGAQQMPVFCAHEAIATVLDYSKLQLEKEEMVSIREGYKINIVNYDMTRPLPFPDGEFDIIFHPVSNCYVESVKPILKECYRILKKGGIILCGFDSGINYITFDEVTIENSLPFNPLKDKVLYDKMIEADDGIQFSHTLEENIGGLLEAGFIITNLYEDTNGRGRLHDMNIPTFYAVRAKK